VFDDRNLQNSSPGKLVDMMSEDEESVTKKKRSPRINSKGMEKDLLLSPGSPRSPREV
jgi:hypothetical protein